MDVHTKQQRSFNMSRIKGQNSKPESLIKNLFRDLKIPFKSNYKHLPGKPDIYVPSLSLVIHVNGCFWHGHKNCKFFKRPRSNTQFWINKINGNIERDLRVNKNLKKMELRVCTIWTCEIKNGKFFDKILNYL